MTHAEAIKIVAEITERLSLLKDYVACQNEFDIIRFQMFQIGDGQTKLATIADIVAREFNVSVEAMRGPGRPEYLTLPRQSAMYLSYKISAARISLETIGKWYGGRDHGTVLHAIKATENRLWADTNGIREKFARIEHCLGEISHRNEPPKVI